MKKNKICVGGNENDEVAVRMSSSKCGECSALIFIFKKSGAVRDSDMWKKIASYKR